MKFLLTRAVSDETRIFKKLQKINREMQQKGEYEENGGKLDHKGMA